MLLRAVVIISFFSVLISLSLLISLSPTAGGAPDYLSPEHIFCTGVDHGVDLWAMGVLVFEMSVKRTPFNPDGDANVQEIFKSIAQTKVSLLVCLSLCMCVR